MARDITVIEAIRALPSRLLYPLNTAPKIITV